MIERIAPPGIVDPVCGRPVDPLRARAVGIFGGQTRYFCSAECKAAYATNSGKHVIAPDVTPTPTPPPKPAPILADVPVIPPRAPIVEVAPAPIASRPRSRAGLYMIVGIVGAALALTFLLRQQPPAPVIASPVPVVAPPVVAPAPAAAPVEPSVPVAAVPTYAGALKLGLRRFVEDGAWSLRLLLIDEAGTPTVVTIASGTGEATDGAVAPEADFARARKEPGVVFKDAAVEVERRPTELVVRREGVEKVVAHLGEDATLRAAPFARARYAEK